MEDRAIYRSDKGSTGADAVMDAANEIIRDGVKPTGALITKKLGWTPSCSTLQVGMKRFYQQHAEYLRTVEKPGNYKVSRNG